VIAASISSGEMKASGRSRDTGCEMGCDMGQILSQHSEVWQTHVRFVCPAMQ
jgi:hypothetical protein